MISILFKEKQNYWFSCAILVIYSTTRDLDIKQRFGPMKVSISRDLFLETR